MKKLTTLLSIMLFLSSGFVFANGLSLNSIGPKSLGMGGAFIGLANDYSAIYWNPAGMTQLHGTQIGVFASDVIPLATYKLEAYKIDATAKVNNYISPNIMAYVPLMEGDLTIGVGAYVPAGLGAEWNGDDLAAFSGPSMTSYEWMSKIAVFNLSPAIAYKINDMFSVGAALNVYYGMFDMKKPMDNINITGGTPVPGKDGMMDTQYDESSSGIGLGFSAGLLVRPIDNLQVGLSFKTKNTIAFSGTAKNSGNQLMDAIGMKESDFDRDIAWPLWYGIGVAWKPIDNLTIAVDAQFSQWSVSEKELTTTYKDWLVGEKPMETTMNMEWKDAWQIRFGVQYDVSKDFAARVGFYIDPAPAPDKTLNILFPSNNYNAVTAGFSYALSDDLGLDFGIEYLMGDDRNIDIAKQYVDAMPGIHHTDILALSLGFSYVFGKCCR